jgi:hypothetical protein
LTSSSRQFRLNKIDVCCRLRKLVRPMMLQGCCKADRAEVVERDRFATPNSLKSHGERNLISPVCAITPKLCMPSRPQYTLRKIITRHSNHVPRLNLHSARGTAAAPHFPRFRALALFGRRPPQRVDSIVMPASENLHNNRRSFRRIEQVILPDCRQANGRRCTRFYAY